MGSILSGLLTRTVSNSTSSMGSTNALASAFRLFRSKSSATKEGADARGTDRSGSGTEPLTETGFSGICDNFDWDIQILLKMFQTLAAPTEPLLFLGSSPRPRFFFGPAQTRRVAVPFRQRSFLNFPLPSARQCLSTAVNPLSQLARINPLRPPQVD